MVGELFLVRHAKAESRDLGKPDFERKLTEAGINNFNNFLPEIIPLFEEKQKVKIWTSPLVRAQETTELLLRAARFSQAEEKEFLASGNFKELLQALQREPRDVTVICVGHEPSVSMWTEELTGVELYFPIGGVVQITFTDDRNTTGKLVLKTAPNKTKPWN